MTIDAMDVDGGKAGDSLGPMDVMHVISFLFYFAIP